MSIPLTHATDEGKKYDHYQLAEEGMTTCILAGKKKKVTHQSMILCSKITQTI